MGVGAAGPGEDAWEEPPHGGPDALQKLGEGRGVQRLHGDRPAAVRESFGVEVGGGGGGGAFW